MEFTKTAHREKFVPNPKARLREQVREVMRFHHYSIRTEETVLVLAMDSAVHLFPQQAASTQNQALNALMF